jgi:hypothetical protein
MFKKGDRVLVFNSKEWMKTGDINYNEMYWQTATVIGTGKSKRGELTADVLFDNGTKSNSHFQNGMYSLLDILRNIKT